ncbi:NAD(P)-dependent dehydrogenase (short-subunit alcohol dehydrogenase family) [Rhodococcus wratislaviensis]|uniref:Oxidoreductase n=2 Tax=Rhodococcus TaxID=1827 RepID=A0AB38F795_RHOWR|nr:MULTISPECIES: SDR family oxidoreductase [Rhodococcus]AII03272.1 3-oxoacyl-ACP reductase [Rhodococcus opacus]REE77559.1 NAD(P)-dependent dehydrogenase (short-subunit alcohol dehydrogenase family) [Rhodococcus wratislaviensis]SPZ35257.1 oxidoreductase [Rhodococcus wratislaviensis]
MTIAEHKQPRSRSLTYAGGAALVTGAASGIGEATASALLNAGVKTLCLDLREPAPFDGVDQALQVRRAVDVTDTEALSTVLAEEIGPAGLSYVVNCAGIIEHTGFADVSHQSWLRCLEVNLIGAYNVVNTSGRFLRDATHAAVVNVTSLEAARVIALTDPDPNPQYAASKAGLAMLTRTAARALASTGVRVNSVSPGFVATPMAAVHGDTTHLSPQLKARVPLGRFASAGDIADAVTFLLSDQASYITGADLRVDGGFEVT